MIRNLYILSRPFGVMTAWIYMLDIIVSHLSHFVALNGSPTRLKKIFPCSSIYSVGSNCFPGRVLEKKTRSWNGLLVCLCSSQFPQNNPLQSKQLTIWCFWFPQFWQLNPLQLWCSSNDFKAAHSFSDHKLSRSTSDFLILLFSFSLVITGSDIASNSEVIICSNSSFLRSWRALSLRSIKYKVKSEIRQH